MSGADPLLGIPPAEAPRALGQLAADFCALPVDFADVPVEPEKLDPPLRTRFEQAAAAASSGDLSGAWDLAAILPDGFERDYLRAKIALAARCWFEAGRLLNRALVAFDGYGEAWFLYGMANYQMGLFTEAVFDWALARRVNPNHEDARMLVALGSVVIRGERTDLNPEALVMLPLVAGRGIDVGCGSSKTHPECIGVDLMAPGEVGTEASQKGRVSQSDVVGSGDDLHMFADGQLDYVIARHNLEHYVDPLKALEEWARVLRPGGLLGMVLPDDEQFDTIHADSTHCHVFSQRSTRRLAALVPGLHPVACGIAQQAHSFFAVFRKEGGEPFDYLAALNRHLAGEVAARRVRAEAAGMSDVAAACAKKVGELDPASGAVDDSAHPFPFGAEPSLDPRPGRTVLLLGSGDWTPWEEACAERGLVPLRLPLDPLRRVRDWQVEKIVRELRPALLVTGRFEPTAAELAAGFNLPHLCADDHGIDPAAACDLTHSHLRCGSASEGERHRLRGAATSRFVVPAALLLDEPPVDTGGDAAALLPPADADRYAALRDELAERLMDRGETEEKNAILTLMGRFGQWISPNIEEGHGRDAVVLENRAQARPAPRKGWVDGDGGADPWDDFTLAALAHRFGLGRHRIADTLRREQAARRTRTLAVRLGIPLIAPASRADAIREAARRGIALMVIPRDTIPAALLDAMGAGTAVVVNDTPLLRSLFTPGEELLTFTDDREAARQLAALRDDPARRLAVGTAAREAVAALPECSEEVQEGNHRSGKPCGNATCPPHDAGRHLPAVRAGVLLDEVLPS